MMEALTPVQSYWLLAALALLILLSLFLFLFFSTRQRRQLTAIAVLEERLVAREAEIGKLERELAALEHRFREEVSTSRQLQDGLSRQETLRQQETLRHEEKISLLKNAREQMSMEFRTLANEILEQKGRSFSESNHKQIESLLKPLGEKIQLFEKKVDDTYDRESKQRFALEREIKALLELNTRISTDADNLTRALKGENKTQGNWGEVILERVLEKSGLERGREYEVQVSLKDAEGVRSQPDVIVHLPEGKDVIIDSKVSLKDYEAYFSEEDETLRAEYLRRHIQSVRSHVKELSAKQYPDLQGVNSLDFVLLFLPLEPAFTLAVQQDNQLFTDAFTRNIILVGPSTLLATLRTIQSIWRVEYQSRNAQLIAEGAGKLYEQFVAFTQELDRVGDHLDRGHQAWENACKRLSHGRGNLVRQVEKLKKLGAKTSKSLAERWLDDEQELLAEELDQEQADIAGSEGGNEGGVEDGAGDGAEDGAEDGAVEKFS